MSKSKRSKGRKSEPEQTYWQQYYRTHKSKYAEWGRKYRERKKAEKAAAQAPTQRKRSK